MRQRPPKAPPTPLLDAHHSRAVLRSQYRCAGRKGEKACLVEELKLGRDLVYPCWEELLRLFGTPSQRCSHSASWRLRFYPFANFLVSRERMRQYSHAAYGEVYRRVVHTRICVEPSLAALNGTAPSFEKNTLAGGIEHLAAVLFGNQPAEAAPAATLPRGPEDCQEQKGSLKHQSGQRSLPVKRTTRPDCSRWLPKLPPPPNLATKWVVHDGGPPSGLGDWLASLLSAYLLASALGRAFYVKSPFPTDWISFAPYDTPPPAHNASVTVREAGSLHAYRCPSIGQLRDSAMSVIHYRGSHRICAHTWATQLAPLWDALGGTGASFDDLESNAALLYGCALRRLFKEGPALLAIASPKSSATRFAVHLRYGDAYFNAGCRYSHTDSVDTMARSLQELAGGIGALSKTALTTAPPPEPTCLSKRMHQGLRLLAPAFKARAAFLASRCLWRLGVSARIRPPMLAAQTSSRARNARLACGALLSDAVA